MRVVFAGTPPFAAQALLHVIQAGHEVPLVLTQPDRPAGRGQKPQPPAVKVVAQAHGIPVLQPLSLRLDGRYPADAQAAQAALVACAPDAMVVAAYGLILPAWTLTLPRWGCLNIHASLLPRWRGAAPIHRAIEAGDPQTGVSIMQMDEGLDTGAVLLAEPLAIASDDTTPLLHDKLADLGARLVVQVLAGMAQHPPTPVPQPTEGVTYARKLDKTESWIDWRQPAEQIERRVRAFQPSPGTQTLYQGEPIKVCEAHVEPQAMGAGRLPAGTVSHVASDGVRVQTGEGLLCVTALQRPGGRRLPVQAFLQGHPLAAGAVLQAPGQGG